MAETYANSGVEKVAWKKWRGKSGVEKAAWKKRRGKSGGGLKGGWLCQC